ncbi:MAG: two-component system sensor histidine kinase NtrB [Deltaproteobacteria bacterium]
MNTVETNTGFGRSLALRLAVAAILIGGGATTYWVNGYRNTFFSLIFVLALFYAASFSYLLLGLFFKRQVNTLNFIQIASDIVFASCVVYVTGGRSSPFVFLYALIIIFASIRFSKTTAYVSAASSGIMYFLIILYEMSLEAPQANLALPASGLNQGGVEYTYFNLAGFILIAMLSGYLSEKFNIARRELLESTENLDALKNIHENILNSLTSGVITLDTKGRIISANRMGLQILGIDTEFKLLGHGLPFLMPGVDIINLISKKREEISYKRPDGGDLTLGFSSSALRDKQNSMKGYIIIFQDLSQVKELEDRLRASEKLALLGQLSAGLAHEIRNPLSAISGSVEILRDEVTQSDENTRLLRITSQEVEKLNLIVEDFLLFAKPEGKSAAPIDIGLTVRETAEAFSMSARRSNLRIEVSVEDGLYVEADAYRIKQALWNLMLNSMQAMPDGGEIKVACLSNGEQAVEVRVSDTGFGIDEEILHKIFEPFFSTKDIGTGLGLAIVQKIVKGYNGFINIETLKGRGTTFIINLPKMGNFIPDTGH